MPFTTKILMDLKGFISSAAIRIGLQNFYQTLWKVVRYLNFLGRTNFVNWLNYWFKLTVL